MTLRTAPLKYRKPVVRFIAAGAALDERGPEVVIEDAPGVFRLSSWFADHDGLPGESPFEPESRHACGFRKLTLFNEEQAGADHRDAFGFAHQEKPYSDADYSRDAPETFRTKKSSDIRTILRGH